MTGVDAGALRGDLPQALSRRRRFPARLTVRALMVLVLALGAGFGWGVLVVREARVQREAVAAIERRNGYVQYDGRERRPWAPRWLVRRLGADFFGTAVKISFRQTTDADLAQAGRLKGLEALVAQNGPVTDAGLAHLAGLTRLSRLKLDSTEVTDAGLAHIQRLETLRDLGLSGTKVTDAGLPRLAGLKRLGLVALRGTGVTDAGVAALRQARPDLRVLYDDRPPIVVPPPPPAVLPPTAGPPSPPKAPLPGP